MDLSLPIIGILGFLGYKLNENGKEPRNNTKVREEISPNEKPSSGDIYNSDRSQVIFQQERDLTDKNFTKAKNFRETGVFIPKFSDNYCEWDCDKPGSFVPIKTRPMFRTKVKPKKKYSENFKEKISKGLVSELTGKPIERFHSDITAPLFGSTVKQNTCPKAHQTVFETFTGNIEDIEKDLTNKRDNVKQDVFGLPNITNFSGVTERYSEPSIYKNSERLFPSIYVKPIPAEEQRNDIKYKDVNELRIRPKISYQLPSIEGQREIIPGNKIGKLIKEKRQPEFRPDIGVLTGNINSSYTTSKYTDYNKNGVKNNYIPPAKSNIQFNNVPNQTYINKEQDYINSSRAPAPYKKEYGESYIQNIDVKQTHKENHLFSYTPNAISSIQKPFIREPYTKGRQTSRDNLIDVSDRAPQGQLPNYISGSENWTKYKDDEVYEKIYKNNYIPTPNASNHTQLPYSKFKETPNKDIMEQENNIDPSILTPYRDNPFTIKSGSIFS